MVETRACGLDTGAGSRDVSLETVGAFGIAENTRSHHRNQAAALVPWARSEVPGGGWKQVRPDEVGRRMVRGCARLKTAGERDIVVEVTLFCPFYNGMPVG
ncbi:MAG: hypothetical protein H7A48_02875 [Akkermansiaceae bacterium]|nr:hypothetical protein [Akkermansiaceae bacterium]